MEERQKLNEEKQQMVEKQKLEEERKVRQRAEEGKEREKRKAEQEQERRMSENSTQRLHMTPVTSPTASPKVMDAILFLQTAKGSWLLSKELSTLLGVSLEELKKGRETTSEEQWATAVVLAVLQVYFSGASNEWMLIKTKASKFIESTLEAGDVDPLCERAYVFLQAHPPVFPKLK